MKFTLTRETMLFLVFGGLTTLIHFVVFRIGYIQLGLSVVVATTIAFIVAVSFSYLVNYHVTFQSDQQHSISSAKFIVSTVLGFIWNVTLMHLLIVVFGMHYVLAFILVTGVVMVNNFLLFKFWVFGKSKS